jgi:predicted TIM-barrel fold metal-dependent hydrolase
MSDSADLQIIDCHIHIRGTMSSIANMADVMQACDLSGMNVLSVASQGGTNTTQNVVSMLFKALYPGQIWAFGALQYSLPGDPQDHHSFAEQARRLMQMGADGMKMGEGKPTLRKATDHPLDAPVYDEYYAFCEAEGIPILFHVADPPDLWDPDKVPEWARARGWFYGDGTYPALETLYGEVDGILAKFPTLHIILAHFYFMSYDIERAARFLDTWPNISFDLTPGGDMYVNFTKDPEKWHGFFVKYQGRILFGTDNSGGNRRPNPDRVPNARDRINAVRRFIETEDEFPAWGITIRGIGLDREVLEKIYRTNFYRYAGENPKPVDIGTAIEEGERMLELVHASSVKDEVLPRMDEVMDGLRQLHSGGNR